MADDDNPLQQYNHNYEPIRVYPEGWVDDPDSASGKGVFKFWGGNDDFEQPDAWVDSNMDNNQWEWGYNHPTIPELRGEGVANSRDEAIAAAEEHHQHTQNRPGNYDYKPTGFDGFINTSSRVPNFVRTSAPRLPIDWGDRVRHLALRYRRSAIRLSARRRLMASKIAARWQNTQDQELKFWEPEEGRVYNEWTDAHTNVTRLRGYISTPYGDYPAGHVDLEDPDEDGNRRINAIDIDRDWRGQGVGRALLQHAMDIGYRPRHSGEYTPEGEQFAYRTPEFGPVHPDEEEE